MEFDLTAEYETIRLSTGSHKNAEEGMCAMEWASVLAGEPFSDRPTCTSPAIAGFMRSWNDSLSDEDRPRLKKYIPRILNTNDPLKEEIRSYMAMDWYIRENVSAWLELSGLDEEAAAIRNLPPIYNLTGIIDATGVLSIAQKASSAAESAAESAAWSAAESAAWSAARSAARKIFQPTEQKLQESAFRLLERMIEA